MKSFIPRGARAALSLVALVLVTGCATVQKQAYDPASNKDVRVIGLLEPNPTKEYQVINVGHLGNAFGLIGAIVASADIQGKTADFTKAMQSRGLDAAAEYRDALRKGLEARGYVVKIIAVERPRGLFLDQYDTLDPSVDAYLDSNIGAGYLCASATSDYLPAVRANTRMVKRTTREIVYRELVAYGFESKAGQPVSIASADTFRYKDHAELMAHPDQALDGLRNGISAVADRTLRDLGAK